MGKVRIGITIGDINGVGLEVILKTLQDERILKYCIPVIYGSSKVVSYHKNLVEGMNDFQYQNQSTADKLHTEKVNVVNCWNEDVNITLGKASDVSGKFAITTLEAATNDLRDGKIDALVTAPINKKAMQMADFPFPGHTEYLTQNLGGKESLMLMVGDRLKVGLVTNHLPIKEVAESITKAKILQKIKIFNTTLKRDFGISKPMIAILGLNPHAGDEGVLGKEEEEIIRPAIIEAKKKGAMVMGPYPADGFFGSKQAFKFDGILAMYHDQGLVPFKALTFGSGVNFTAGLDGIRTSPDHGTAYDIAGKGIADPSSFRQALFLAKDIFEHRTEFEDIENNALKTKEKPSEDVLAKDDQLKGIAEE